MVLQRKLHSPVHLANLFYLNEGMADCLQIHSLFIFIVVKELYLKAYGHSGIPLLNLMYPDSKNVRGNQEMYSKCARRCTLYCYQWLSQGLVPSEPGTPGICLKGMSLPKVDFFPSLPSPGFWIRAKV